MENTLKRLLSFVVALVMVLGMVPFNGLQVYATEEEVAEAATTNVAKVGSTEYATIDEAIAAWTDGTTLTLLSDVTLSDVIKLSSTEYHILDLGTYTMTAASGKDAIQYVVNGRSNASYALDIKADATNPGGITATGKTIVSHIKPSSDAPSKDRPITRFYGGIFNASYVVKQGGTSSWGFLTSGYTGASAPYFQFYGGEFNGTIYTNRSQNQFHGGTFNGNLQMSVDSSAYTQIAGGTFKNLSNLMGSALTSDKFVIGSAKGANDGSVCIDENGNYVITTTTPTEAEASVASNYNSNNYFYYSTVNTDGMYYEDVYDALEANETGTVTVFTEELDLSDTTFTGTIVVPEGEEVTIVVAEGVTPAWTIESAVENEEPNVTYEDANGNELVKNESGAFEAPDYAVMIGEKGYATLAEALTAAADMTGDVTVEIYDKVTLNSNLSGSFDSIKFVGKDTDAEIYLDVQGYITATGKKVAFEDLTLSKSEGTYIGNAGFMNVAFGVYDVTEVTYTNCIFANGAYASSGEVTYTGCTFYRSYDKYGLWAYGNVDVTVDGCTFADYRGIKMYAEGAAKTVDLTVKNTDFSAVNDKPAIVLTYGESVTLEGNTYSDTGAFELDLDGAPNGTAVTTDTNKIVCVNDNGACGVLVDGNIYTTVAQAAAVATSGSTVTLLHDSTETVELAEGVTLNKNGYTADGVSVKAPAVAQIGDTKYADLHEAMVACKSGETVLLIADVDLAGTEWEPVSFKGTFDGQDHTISNLTINKPGVSNTGFITSLNGTFKNVTFTNPTVTGGENTGVIAGRAGGGAALAENITVNGTIKVEVTHSGYARAAVIVGGWAYGNYKDITVDGGDKAVSYVKHTGGGDGRYVAGIVGHADDVESYVNCTVKNITIDGDWLCGAIAGPGPADGLASGCAVENVDIHADYSGGMFGWYYGGGTIENSSVKNVAFTAGTTNNGAIGGYGANPDAKLDNVTIENVTNGDKALLEHVAEIDGTYYFSLQAAIEAVAEGETIELLRDVTVTTPAYGQNALNHARAVNFTLDLNGKTLSADTGNSVLRFNIANSGATADVTITVKNGKIVSGANTWCAVMASGIDGAKAVMNLEGLTIENNKGGDYAVKAWANGVVNAKNVTVNASYGGGFYALGGEIVLDDCTVNQKGLWSAPYLSMAVGVSNGGKMTVNSGTYTAVPVAAADGNNQGTSHGSWCGGVMSSGGTLIINGGTFSNGAYGDGTPSNPRELLIIGADADYGDNVAAQLTINGGTFTSIGALTHCETIWGSENDAANTYMPTMAVTITGGNFTGVAGKTIGGCDPISTGNPVEVEISGGTYAANNAINSSYLAAGHEIVENTDGTYGVETIKVAQIGETYYATLQAALDAAAAGTGEVTVEILRDVDLTNVDWNPVTVSAPGYPLVTVNGNNKTITGLNDMLFAGTWAGKSGLIINDLTIKDSKIENDVEDSKGNVGVGAFIGYPQASATITLNNCHLVDSTVSGGHWTGGLIGMAGGYNGNDGPVFMNLTITGCSVTDSTITGKGSAGGVIGHGSCAAWTNVVIENTVVSGNTITSTGSSTNKAGSVMGTIGAAGQPATAAGETKTGGASVSATTSGNTVTSGGTTITTIYGRQGTETGMLTVTGGTYEAYPIEKNVSYAAPADGYEIVENTDGTYSIETIKVAQIGETKYDSLTAAIKAATAGQTITLLADVNENVTISKSITIDGADFKYTGTMTANAGLTVTVQNVNFVNGGFAKTTKSTTGTYTVKNCAFDGEGSYAYPFIFKGANTVTIENCTVTNYLYSFLYITSGTNTVSVKNVTVEDCPSYAVYFASGVNTATFENLTVKNSNNGFVINNTANRAFTIKNCNMENVGSAISEANGTNTITCTALGVNDFGSAAISEYVTFVAAAKNGGKIYESLAKAVEEAQAGDTVTILAGDYTTTLNVNKAITVVGETDAEGNNLVNITGKLNITADGATVKNLNVDNGSDTAASINAKDVLVEGCTVVGGNGFRYCYTTGTVTFKDSTITGSTYGIHFDGSTGGNIVIDNCVITGWTSFAGTITKVAIEDTTFAEGNYNKLRFYQNATLTNCTFNEEMSIDFGKDAVALDVTGCTVENGGAMTDIIYLPDLVDMGIKVTVDSKPVVVEATVGETYYLSLQDAIDNAQAGDIVKLTANVVLTDTLTIPAAATTYSLRSTGGITLDLNGKIISMETADDTEYCLIYNNGDLTIIDSGENGKLSYQYTGTNSGDAYNTIESAPGSVLTVKSGTIENLSANCLIAYAIDGLTNGSLGDVTVNIEGGKITSKKIAVRIFANSTTNVGTLNISGGEISGRVIIQNANATANKAVLSITGGTFNTNGYKTDVLYVGGSNGAAGDITASVSGGTFNGEILSSVNKGFISGGTFVNEPAAELLALGYIAEQNSEGLYEVKDDPKTLYITNLAELKAFRDDVNAGNTYKGMTVYLAADIDLGSEEWTPIGNSTNKFQGTFDGQNHTISNLVITGSNSYVGFFGFTTDGEIKNLTINNALVSGRLGVGVVAGSPYTSKYTNIKVTGHVEVNGMAYVGGVGGRNAYADWTNITVDVDDTSYVKAVSTENGVAYRTYVGGVVGFVGEGGHTFTNISSNINVIGDVCDIGGIFGIVHYNNNVVNVSCSGNVTSTGEADEIGGIAGVWHNEKGTEVEMTGVTFTGTVSDVNGAVEGVDIVGGAYNASNETPETSGSLKIDGEEAWLCVAKIGEVKYQTLAEAVKAVQEGETITILATTISEGTIKLPATLKNVTFKGAEGTVLKDMTIMASDGNAIDYQGLTFDGITFENSRISITGWRTGGATVKDLTVTNCTFQNLNDTTNSAPVHINMSEAEAVENFTFTNNVIDGATGGSKSGVYAQTTGKTVFTGNTINNVAFRPYVIQITTDDGIADEFIVTGNTFSGSAAGRAQGLGNNSEGTDTVKLVVSENIFKGITSAQQICYWNFNEETTTADLSKNYYDIDILNNPTKIYYNSAAQNADDLIEMGVFPYYADEAKTTLVEAPAIMVTYADGTIEYFEDMRVAVPHTSNYPKLEGATVTLLKDMSGLGMRLMENGMVFDLNGYTYTLTGGTGSKGTETSAFQIRPEVTETATIKNGTIQLAEGVIICWIFNNYATNFVVEDVTVDCTNMDYSYGESCYVHVSRSGDNTQFIGNTKIENFNSAVAGDAINVGGTMTVGENVDLGGGSFELDAGASLTAPADLDVTTEDGYMVVYKNGTYTSVAVVAQIGTTQYESLAEAIAAAQDGDTVTLLADITVDTETYTIADGMSITLDMNGKTITATDSHTEQNTTGNFELFYIYGELTVTGNGTIELTATTDRDWNASSSIFHNRGGVLTIENGTYKHLGGTDMAYVVDNSGNWYGEATTNIKDGTLSSTYTAIRNRMEQNSHGASGTAILNISGGTITGTTSAIWAQAASTSPTAPATGEINISGGEIGLINTARSSGAECMTTIAGGTVAGFKGEVNELTVTGGTIGDVTILTPAGETTEYAITAAGLYTYAVAQVNDKNYATLQEALDAAQDGDTVTLLTDVEVTESLVLNTEGTITIDGAGHTIKPAAGYTDKQNALLMLGATDASDDDATKRNYTIKNVVFDGTADWSVIRSQGVTLTMDNCTIQNCVQTNGQALIRLDYTDATIQNTTIKNNNALMAITHNFNGNSSNLPLTVDNCVIEGNSFNKIAAIYYVTGSGCQIQNSEFVDNTVNCNNNGAVIYLGFQDNCTITGNLFKNNEVTDSSASARVAGAIFAGYQATITGNAFDGNTAANANGDTLGQVCISTYYEDGLIELSGNYWNGEAPVLGEDITIQHQTGNADYGLSNYYTAYSLDSKGNVALSGEVENTYVAQIVGSTVKYTSLADAIAAAQAGQTITLLADVNENVTINKNLTIDGAGKTYTGTMTANAGLTVTVQNVNFVNGGFDKSTKSTTGKYTVKNCTFDGEGKFAYAFRFKGANAVTIENCTVKDYLYSFLYVTSGTNAVSVKNVTVEDCPNYAVYFASGVNAATFENLTVKNSNNGFIINNTANRTFTIKNCNMVNVTSAITEANGTKTITCTVLGVNVFGSAAISEYGKLVLGATDATLTAPEDMNVTSGVVGYVVSYADGVYSLVKAIAKIGDTYYKTFAEALDAVQDGETITLIEGAEGSELKTEIEFTKDIEFTITGNAPAYELPVVTFLNATVNIKDAEILIPELDARQDATINVIDSIVHDAGGNGIVKSYYNGAINISGTSVVHTMQVTTMGTITVSDTAKLNATWQTNIYGNGMITVEDDATFATAALHLTGQDYSGRDNTDADRVGKPAALVVDGANLIVGKVYSDNGADYSYNSSKGINIGTVDGKSAVLDIKNGANVSIYMANGETANIGAGGTVNVADSVFTVSCRAENGTVTLANNGTINVSGESDIAASNVTGAGWVYMNGVTLDADTKLIGAKVRFASGTNNIDGSVIDDGFFQVGIGAYNGVDANVDTVNGVTVNVKNAKIGSSGSTYAGWVGTGFYDTDDQKAAAMTDAKYVLNIENSVAEFGYLHVSNDGELNVTGNAAEKAHYNNSEYSFYAGDFIINGVATFDATDVLALYTKVSCDNGTDKPGTLNIVNGTEYEAERHNGAIGGTNFEIRKTGVVNVDKASELYIGEYTSIATNAVLNIAGEATALGTITNNGTINLTDVAATLTTPKAPVVKTTVKDYEVTYADGAYKLSLMQVAQNTTTSKIYPNLQAAIDAAQDGETVQLIADLALDKSDAVIIDNTYPTFFLVEGKTVTIDLNGHTIDCDADGLNKMLVGVFSTDNNGHLTITGNGTVKVVNGAKDDSSAGVYSLVANYESGCSIVIENGTYTLDAARDCLLYSGVSANNANEGLTINGGTFTLGNVGAGTNGQPWIFNVLGANQRYVRVNGGTFNADVNHQFWANEVYVPETLALQANGDGTWTVVEAVAYVTERATSTNASDRKVGYATLAEAVAAAKNGKTITLLKDIELNESIANNGQIVLDLNGKTITGTDSTTKNFGLINNNGTLTINDSVGGGKITLTATNNSGWNRYSAVISNNPGGTLVVNGGTLEHLGGTDMAYAIDSLTNGGIGDVSVTINGGTVKSTYRAIRQFLNSDSKQNVLTINGGTIEGTNTGIFFHDPSKKANNGTLTVAEGASVNGVYLFVTEGSTEWPVEVAIAEIAVGDKGVTEKNVPVGYDVKEVDGIIGVYKVVAAIGDETYATLQAAIDAANAGETVKLLVNTTETVTVADGKNVIIDLDSKTLNGSILAPNAELTIQNGAIVNSDKGVSALEINSGKLTLTNVNIDSARHAIRIDGAVEATINGGTYRAAIGTGTGTYHAVNVSGAATVTIVDGTFVGPKGTTADSGSAVNAQTGATVKIEGGNFSGGKRSTLSAGGTISATGGTYDQPVIDAYCATGYKSFDNGDGTYTVKLAPKAHFETGAYASTAPSKPREHVGINVYDIIAYESLVIEVYDEAGNHIVTSTYRDYDLDDLNTYRYPVTAEKLTVNIVVSGKEAGSWDNKWHIAPSVANIPAKFEVWVDGELKDTWTEGFESEAEKNDYIALEGVYKAASVTSADGEKVTYYATVQAAIDAANAGETVKVLTDVTIAETVKVEKDITIDLNGKTITTAAAEAGNYVDAFLILADVTITGEGTVDARPSHGYTFYVGDKDGNSGNLTIKNGTYYGETSVVNNRLGTVTIEGGHFEISLENAGDTYNYLLNCIDDNYKAGTAKIVVTGGTFVGFNPKNNAAEGEKTNFCALGYHGVLVDGTTDTYMVEKNEAIVAWNMQTGEEFETVAEALAAAKAGETVQLLKDSVEEKAVLVILNNRTLDLNGYTLTADYAIATSVDAHIMDSSDAEGLLKVAKSNLTLPTNDQLPVWIAEESGFKFAELIIPAQRVNDRGNGTAQYVMFVDTANSNKLIGEELLDGAADGDGIKITVKMTYKDDLGRESMLIFAPPADMVQTYGYIWVNNLPTGIGLIVNGLDAVEDIKFQTIFSYGITEIAGEPVAFTAG